MAHKKQKPLSSDHPKLKILSELEETRGQGAKFPDYNPPPKRKTEMRKDERKAYKLLKEREQKRNTPIAKSFVGWEYKDRYAHRKTE